MKVLLVNGSPRAHGCTYTALCEVAKALEEEGVETEIFQTGAKPVQDCIACSKCRETGKCVFHDAANELAEKAKVGEYDAVVPTVGGQSWIYGYSNLVLDPTDPLTEGYTIGDLWA